jgi:hypothetical protein
MWQEERYQRIRALLALEQRISTDRLVKELQVSRETVRRDVAALEAQGQLRRTHGGIVRQSATEAPDCRTGTAQCPFQRGHCPRGIGRLCAGQTVFIDAGTTTALLARQLAGLSGLTIITNAFDVALALRQPEGRSRHQVIMLGGELGERAAATVVAARCHPPLPGRHRPAVGGVSGDMGSQQLRSPRGRSGPCHERAGRSNLYPGRCQQAGRQQPLQPVPGGSHRPAGQQPAGRSPVTSLRGTGARRWESCGWYKAVGLIPRLHMQTSKYYFCYIKNRNILL